MPVLVLIIQILHRCQRKEMSLKNDRVSGTREMAVLMGSEVKSERTKSFKVLTAQAQMRPQNFVLTKGLVGANAPHKLMLQG